MLSQIGLWLAAGLTLALYSFLWKDNPVYRAVEYLYVGVGAGYGIVTTYDAYVKPTVTDNLAKQHQWILLIPILIGLLMYTRYVKSIAFLARWSMAFFMGIGAGYVLTTEVQPRFIAQVAATIKPFWVPGSIGVSVNNILLAAGVMCTLIYFFFTTKKIVVLETPAKFGRLVMMVAFGASFGNTVMARVSTFLGRVVFLLSDWLHIIK
jgi:hypothetical protein